MQELRLPSRQAATDRMFMHQRASGEHPDLPRGVLRQGKSLGGLARGNRIVILSSLTYLGAEQTRRGELHVLGSPELNSR